MSDRAKRTKPEPVVVQTICSMCALPWEQHGEDPTTEDCIRLLRAELAKRPAVIGYPSYPHPIQPWRGPYWSGIGTSVRPNTAPPTITCQVEAKTPRLAESNGGMVVPR